MRRSVAVLAFCGLLAACGRAAPSDGTGELRVRLSGASGGPMALIVVRNVFDHNQTYLVDCAEKDHLLDGQAFCDELLVLPPGAYELIIQSLDPTCRTELDHYKVLVQAGKTVEVPVTLVCRADSGGLDVVVTTRDAPRIDYISFHFKLSELRANKYICHCGEAVTAVVAVSDSDTACTGLQATWSAVDSASADVTATLLSNPQAIPGSPCLFSIDVDSATGGTFQITFSVTDGTTAPSAITFPVHIVECDSLCNGCPNGSYLCGNSCVDLLTDEANCGTCGNACAFGQTCTLGLCSGGCPAGQTACNGSCVDLLTDELNCGTCGTACDPGEECHAGLCTADCPVGQTECDGTCTNLQTDEANCGACGNVCDPGESCIAGSCSGTCVGEAGDFAILGVENGTVSINSANVVIGDVGYSKYVVSTVNQKIGGGTPPDIWTGAAYVHTGITAFAYESKNYLPSGGIHTGSAIVNARLDQANTDAISATAAFAGLTPNLTFGAVTSNLTVNRTGPVTVVRINSLDYNSNVLHLVGQSGGDDAFIIQVTGNFEFAQSEVRLTNVRPERVVFVFPNASSIKIYKASSIFNGTILAPTSSVLYHNPATFNGALIAKYVDLHSDFNLTYRGLDLLCPPY